MNSTHPTKGQLAAVALIAGTLLLTELALTRIFSVIMFYHFAFLAISIALFGLSASGVAAYIMRRRISEWRTETMLSRGAVVFGAVTLLSLAAVLRIHPETNYSLRNLLELLLVYSLAALPFLTGGFVLTLAITRFASRINVVYASDLAGAAAGCLLLIPLLNAFGAPGVVLTASGLAMVAAVLFAAPADRRRISLIGAAVVGVALVGHSTGIASFDVEVRKGHIRETPLFSKWNSFSRISVYKRPHQDWSVSTAYKGPRAERLYMDIDAAASTPILQISPDLSNAQYLKYELTALAYHLQKPGFQALVIGPGGGRDLVSALVFGAAKVDGVEINPIIANDVMREKFLEESGRIYNDPRVRITIDDGRSYVRRSEERYHVIQASLVDTWAATAAGAYTLTENSLYTVEAFNDYFDHLTDDGVLTITRWVSDGLRLVSLAQEAGEARGWDARTRLAVIQQDEVATFIFKKSPFTDGEVAMLRRTADEMGFFVVYAPAQPGQPVQSGQPQKVTQWNRIAKDYTDLVLSTDRRAFYERHDQDIAPTTDDRPFFFHTTKLKDQFGTAFGREMLFGNGLSALMSLMAISATLVVTFVVAPLAFTGVPDTPRWGAWLVYFGALGGGFMLIEVAMLQQFVLLLGHPVYSLTVTLFSLLVGTGIGSAWSRRLSEDTLARSTSIALVGIAALGVLMSVGLAALINWGVPMSRVARIALATATLVPAGIALGIPMPAGIRLLSARAPGLVPWAWAMNGALSVMGATAAIFIAMNWGFSRTLLAGSLVYVVAVAAVWFAAGRSRVR
jgi:hypothetical protein